MTEHIFRIHPSINFARVGTSEDYYIAPETAAGELVDQGSGIFGGLPVKKNTEDTFVTANDLRDAACNPKRQAARFRIFAYDSPLTRYPDGGGKEVQIGDVVGGKRVKDIVWTVHLANKKANNYQIASADGQEEGIAAYQPGHTLPPLRNPGFGEDLGSEKRLSQLPIDAGPHAIRSSTKGVATTRFDNKTACSYAQTNGDIKPLGNYPKIFPGEHFQLFAPNGRIDTLGEMTIEACSGRLLVVGGYGRANAISKNGKPPPLDDAIDNNGWFDDTSDGPVQAVVLFDDGSTAAVVGAWFVCTDPGFAPQTRNVVSTWDDVYSTWVEQLALQPELFANGKYQEDYSAIFHSDVLSIFHAAILQRWNTNLPAKAVHGHDFVATIQAGDDPKLKIPNFADLIRDPNNDDPNEVNPKMPLALGDAMKSFLSLNPTQYFLLHQWYAGKSVEYAPIPLGTGEKLDRVVLENCLGGRYSPAIDLTFIVRDVHLYEQAWTGTSGPFRINAAVLNYADMVPDKPFLGVGYVPLRDAAVEPGDLCKFMALPWHTDYNSCAVHLPDPNPKANNTLYWSWPAQRPVSVYPADQCSYDPDTGAWSLGGQVYSVRGDGGHGTHTDYPQQQGRYQCYFDFVENWHKVGFVIQGTQIPAPQGGNYGANKFLETESLFRTDGDLVQPWPTANLPGYKAPSDCGP